MKYKAVYQDVSPETYIHLRVSSGLSPKTPEAAETGLRHSVCSVVIMDTENDNQAVGMGRIIGDGACHCQIVDICVLPDHQKKGLGKLIMQQLKAFIDESLPASCYISLIADGDAYRLYEQYGFQEVWPASRGMAFLKK
ncbi:MULTISPECIES: GNAT family N-acetyltransferase [unclassified Flavobacterium]|uniref:GNAT family N-acetyltransferase n=1 Tax=unclassified Flavobacterium TaxID=196869 RepID=UPI00095E8766|nr:MULTISPECIES: GNAT family N-acetyltransferase [unclassified Flavobacterium]MBN9285495.1 GNAT family N-acetyltransferase [Flavobacterium sp.]OJV71485.1 MAG: N-acetyltransferase [Flavobacterium sp. 40-81]